MGNALFISGAAVALLCFVGLPQRFATWTRWHMWRAGLGVFAAGAALLGLVWSALGGAAQ
jgi:protein-S-isoprenylcysteine O-methyltransferase Ste14